MMVRKLKDRDELSRALRWRMLPFAIIAAGMMFGAGMMTGASLGKCIITAVVAFVIVMTVPLFISDRAGRLGGSLFMPGGSGTPAVREYSLADSLVARGRFDEAVEAYALLSGDHPTDPEPRVRAARLLRDRMMRYNDAAEWFKRALAIKTLDAATEVAILREVVELYTHKLKTPTRALPFLARLAEKHGTHPAAHWARELTADIKRPI